MDCHCKLPVSCLHYHCFRASLSTAAATQGTFVYASSGRRTKDTNCTCPTPHHHDAWASYTVSKCIGPTDSTLVPDMQSRTMYPQLRLAASEIASAEPMYNMPQVDSQVFLVCTTFNSRILSWQAQATPLGHRPLPVPKVQLVQEDIQMCGYSMIHTMTSQSCALLHGLKSLAAVSQR